MLSQVSSKYLKIQVWARKSGRTRVDREFCLGGSTRWTCSVMSPPQLPFNPAALLIGWEDGSNLNWLLLPLMCRLCLRAGTRDVGRSLSALNELTFSKRKACSFRTKVKVGFIALDVLVLQLDWFGKTRRIL